MTNPYALSNFAALRTTNPVLYQRMSANGFFTAATVQRNRLLRPFSHINNLTFSNLPLGEVKVHSLQINVNRRFADGFTANAALSFNSSRANRTVEEFDREPTLWLDDNNSRPFRVSGGAVYELPFGSGRRMLNDGGVLGGAGRRLADWRHLRVSARLADQLQQQPVLLRQHRRHQEEQAGDRPEPERHHRCDEVLVQHRRTSRGTRPGRRPASRRGRSRSRSTACAGPGLTYVNMNVVRNFRLGGRRALQARMDIQNLLNYAAYNNPVTDPTNTNFGRVTTAVGVGRRDAVLQLRGAVHVLVRRTSTP